MSGLRLVCAAVLGSAIAVPAAAEKPFRFDATPGHLPKDVVPEEYDFTIAPDLAALSFQGRVAIRLRVREATRRIVLNASRLEIHGATLSADGRAPETLEPQLDAAAQTLAFTPSGTLKRGSYRLEIAYSGRINPEASGLYLGRYTGPRGEETYLATQFQAVDARRLLPCWDEPVFRAAFRMTVDLPAALRPWSNTPVEAVEDLPGGLRRTHFQRTPPMPSYLLVLVAGRFEALEDEQDGVKLAVTTAEGRRATAAYAMEVTRRLLRYFNDYFGVAYPLPKLDQFALPGGRAGAMENWGGITYEEALLLLDPKSSSPRRRRVIHQLVAHEVAHQWFGDLVTMAWWDNLWLNEGFASWMELKATAHFNPDWNVWARANDEREYAMSLDARQATHPVHQPVSSGAEVMDAFDEITYSKGQSVLRMLEAWLGEAPFRDGIRVYMKRHAHSSTTTADLWAALEAASGQPVRRVARGWIEQPGFPVVRVDARCERGRRRIELQQRHFRSDGPPGPQRWAVPVAVVAGAAASWELLETERMSLTRAGCEGRLLVDPDALGYYRVEYAPALFDQLVAAWPELPLWTRLKLLSDTWGLAGAGAAPASRYLALVQRARHDPEPEIRGEILERLGKLDELAYGDPRRPALREFQRSVLKGWLDQLGWEPRAGEPQPVLELRPRVILQLGRLGDAAVRAEARKRFQRFLRDPDSLPAALADPVVIVAGIPGDRTVREALVRRLRRAQTTEEQWRYLQALGHVEDAALARLNLDLVFAAEMPAQLMLRMPLLVAREHPEVAWAFAREHHETLRPRLNSFWLNGYFSWIVADSVDPAVAAELEDWSARHLPPGAAAMTRRYAEGIRFNALLKQRMLPGIAGALPRAGGGDGA